MSFSGTVRVQINGTWTNLTYNSTSGAWEATITAPGKTSYNLNNHSYVVTAEAKNTAGTVATATANLRVKETVKPVITIISPSTGAYVSNNKQPLVFNITDEANGSGVDTNSIIVKKDNSAVTSGIAYEAITNGYKVTVTPSAAFTDGSHTWTVSGSDFDGNAADSKSTTFKVDTIPPTLNITSPADGLITNNVTCVVAGKTNDATSSPVTVTINGVAVTVSADGTFSKTITLSEGSNTITVVATDSAGKSSTVTRTVTLDTSAPNIKSVTVTPNPANTGESMIVKVVVE